MQANYFERKGCGDSLKWENICLVLKTLCRQWFIWEGWLVVLVALRGTLKKCHHKTMGAHLKIQKYLNPSNFFCFFCLLAFFYYYHINESERLTTFKDCFNTWRGLYKNISVEWEQEFLNLGCPLRDIAWCDVWAFSYFVLRIFLFFFS